MPTLFDVEIRIDPMPSAVCCEQDVERVTARITEAFPPQRAPHKPAPDGSLSRVDMQVGGSRYYDSYGGIEFKPRTFYFRNCPDPELPVRELMHQLGIEARPPKGYFQAVGTSCQTSFGKNELEPAETHTFFYRVEYGQIDAGIQYLGGTKGILEMLRQRSGGPQKPPTKPEISKDLKDPRSALQKANDGLNKAAAVADALAKAANESAKAFDGLQTAFGNMSLNPKPIQPKFEVEPWDNIKGLLSPSPRSWDARIAKMVADYSSTSEWVDLGRIDAASPSFDFSMNVTDIQTGAPMTIKERQLAFWQGTASFEVADVKGFDNIYCSSDRDERGELNSLLNTDETMTQGGLKKRGKKKR